MLKNSGAMDKIIFGKKAFVSCFMKSISLLCGFFTISFALGQQTPIIDRYTYAQYKITKDTLRSLHIVTDTITGNSVEMEHVAWFERGFVYVKIGDMKGLMTPKGKRILWNGHFIRFNDQDSIISAYICSDSWIFLNYQGDTISSGKTPENNYCPLLEQDLNPAYVMEKNKDPQLLWGYLDRKARWKILPEFQAAQPFENGKAKVKIQEKWGMIDENGNYIVKPQYATEDF